MQALRLRSILTLASRSTSLSSSSSSQRTFLAASPSRALTLRTTTPYRAWLSTAASSSPAQETAATPAAQSADKPEVEEEHVVPKQLVRFLIGHRGTNLRNILQKVGGGKITFKSKGESTTEEIALLAGDAAQVAELKKLLPEELEKAKVMAEEAAKNPKPETSKEPQKPRVPRDNFGAGASSNASGDNGNYVEEVIVDRIYVGQLIGAKGVVTKEMEKISGAKISYSDWEEEGKERSARIRGTPAQVQAAKKLITDKIYAIAKDMRGGPRRSSTGERSERPERFQPSPNDVKQVVEVPSEVVGFLIGKGGKGIHDIQDRTKTRLDFAREDHRDGAREVTIYGSEQNVQKACDIIQERVKERYERGQMGSN